MKNKKVYNDDNNSKDHRKTDKDVRLVFEKTNCSECNGVGVKKQESTGNQYVKCEICNGKGRQISYKIKEIEWFNKISGDAN